MRKQAGLMLSVKGYFVVVGKLDNILGIGLGKGDVGVSQSTPTTKNTPGKIISTAGGPSVEDVAASNGSTGDGSYQVIQIL